MKYQNAHPADQQLLLEIDGELSAHEEKVVQAHLAECWKCRVRRQELESAIAGFVHLRQRELGTELPPVAGPRALLKAQLGQLTADQPKHRPSLFGWALAAAACGVLTLAFVLLLSALERQNASRRQALVVSIPDATLTPGAALLASRQAICSQPNTKNKIVPVALQRKVFEEYRIAAAEPRAYEVDYLVTPALGGADDIHNLWPHSYSATIWNARVKDDLEDRLRQMVCNGTLDLATAQHEIAGNWIAAYKKYFRTDKPLGERGAAR